MNDDSYLVAVEQQYLDKVISAKFDILDEVRKLDTEADFPVSLSIGMGAGGKTAAQNMPTQLLIWLLEEAETRRSSSVT